MDFKPGRGGHEIRREFSSYFAEVEIFLVAVVFFLGVPFKCKEDVIPDNEQVQQCQERTTVKPENASIS